MTEKKPEQATVMTSVGDRRPLKTRAYRWAGWLANALVRSGISPNQVSMLSVVSALLCLLCLWASVYGHSTTRAVLYLMAAGFCQLRLLCNLMDGMVAIEGGKRAPDGELWNELPDRVADIVILVGLGVAANAVVPGWAAASLAVIIAYVRELGKGIDGHVDFGGPMAKPQRMAVVTVVLLLAAALLLLPASSVQAYAPQVLQIGLWVLIAGSVLTLWRRTRRLQRRLLDRRIDG